MRLRVAVLAAALAVLPALALGEEILLEEVQGPVDWGAAKSVTRVRRLWLADQPDQQGLERARDNGVTVVINLREPGEMTWDENAAVEGLGLTYIAAPVAREGPLSKEAFERIEAVVKDRPGEQILIHCSTGNRAAAWLATHLVRSHGMKAEDALAVGKRAGLTKEETAAKVDQYLEMERESAGKSTPRESDP